MVIQARALCRRYGARWALARLDLAGFGFVDSLVRELNAQGCTLVIASLQVARAGALCPRAIIPDKGQVRWEGACNDAERAWTALHRVWHDVARRPDQIGVRLDADAGAGVDQRQQGTQRKAPSSPPA